MPEKSADKGPSFSESFSVVGGNFNDAGAVSSRIKSILKKMCLPTDVIRKAAICTYEAEMNIVCYAQRGNITLSVDDDRIVIKADDEGEGIPDIALAMQAGYSTSTAKIREMGFGAGMGLDNIDKFADDFNITSEVGRGTQLVMIVYVTDGS